MVITFAAANISTFGNDMIPQIQIKPVEKWSELSEMTQSSEGKTASTVQEMFPI